MDVIGNCLALAPVPYLALSWSIFEFIWATIRDAQASREQLRALASSIAQLLQTLDAEIRAGRLIPENTSTELDNLRQILEDISVFVRVQSSYGFLKELYKKDDRVAAIEQYHRQVSATVTAFQISGLLNVRDWQSKNDIARAADQQTLIEHLGNLEKNQKELAKALNAQQSNMVAMMASLQKSLLQQLGGEPERKFYSQSLRFLATTSGHQVQLENWMITSFEVDFGPEIGSGGFGQVFKGTWNKTDVALKVLKNDGGAMPSLVSIRREVQTWSRLHHPHILQFLGANILDDRPFILMPYLKNGNSRDYIHDHPNCDRLQILYHVSLGLIYLHSNNIIHGDLKALNVLIDDGERAVLCDFGLSRMKADATSRSAISGQSLVIGSRNWMAPERLRGAMPRKPSDVYAFGMTIYEIMTLDIPLGHLDYDTFTRLVVHEDVRPERPYEDEAPDLSDDLWDLAEQCWVKDPLARPSAGMVCDDMKSFLHMSPHLSPAPAVISPLAPSPVSPARFPPLEQPAPMPAIIPVPVERRDSITPVSPARSPPVEWRDSIIPVSPARSPLVEWRDSIIPVAPARSPPVEQRDPMPVIIQASNSYGGSRPVPAPPRSDNSYPSYPPAYPVAYPRSLTPSPPPSRYIDRQRRRPRSRSPSPPRFQPSYAPPQPVIVQGPNGPTPYSYYGDGPTVIIPPSPVSLRDEDENVYFEFTFPKQPVENLRQQGPIDLSIPSQPVETHPEGDFKVIIKLWDDRAPKTVSKFRDVAKSGRVGPYSFAKYSFQRSNESLTANTYDSGLFVNFNAEQDPNFAQGGFGPGIVALSRPMTKWWAAGEKPSNTLTLCLSEISRGDKQRKWLPIGEVITGLEDLKLLPRIAGIRIGNCGTMSGDSS